MAIGTTAAILMIAGAASQAYGAHKQASAAKDAAKQQVGSANHAKADLAPIYQQNVARMDPYAQLGGQAVGQLRALGGYGAPPPPNANAIGRDQFGNGLGPITANAPPLNMSDPRIQHLAQGGGFENMPGGLSSLSAPSPMGGGGASSYGGSRMTGGGSSPMPQGGMLKMRAPDGEVRDVPQHMAAQLEQAGAVRV